MMGGKSNRQHIKTKKTLKVVVMSFPYRRPGLLCTQF